MVRGEKYVSTKRPTIKDGLTAKTFAHCLTSIPIEIAALLYGFLSCQQQADLRSTGKFMQQAFNYAVRNRQIWMCATLQPIGWNTDSVFNASASWFPICGPWEVCVRKIVPRTGNPDMEFLVDMSHGTTTAATTSLKTVRTVYPVCHDVTVDYSLGLAVALIEPKVRYVAMKYTCGPEPNLNDTDVHFQVPLTVHEDGLRATDPLWMDDNGTEWRCKWTTRDGRDDDLSEIDPWNHQGHPGTDLIYRELFPYMRIDLRIDSMLCGDWNMPLRCMATPWHRTRPTRGALREIFSKLQNTDAAVNFPFMASMGLKGIEMRIGSAEHGMAEKYELYLPPSYVTHGEFNPTNHVRHFFMNVETSRLLSVGWPLETRWPLKDDTRLWWPQRDAAGERELIQVE